MRKGCRFYIILFLLLSVAAQAEIIPGSRRTIWNPGIPGGIPRISGPVQNVLDHGADASGEADCGSAILAAMDALPQGGGVVLIPEGTYLINGTISVSRDNIVFRGEGADKTRLLHDHTGLCFEIVTYQRGEWQSLLDFGKEETSVTVEDAGLFEVGQYAEIMQDNDPALMYTQTDWNQSWAEGAVGQLFEVTAIGGDLVTFRNPLHFEIRSDLNPQIRPQGLVSGVGFENFYVERLQTGNSTFQFKNAAYCWVKGVESYHTRKSHVTNNTTLGCEYRDSYFHHSFSYGGGGSGYGVEFGYHSTDGLCENNVFDSLRHAMMVHVGTVGCVFGYNYSINPVQGEGETNLNQGWIPPDISLHGHYAQMNLFEGNIVQEIGVGDHWGPMGPGNTFLRNVVQGEGTFLYDHSHRQNFVGNINSAWRDDGTSEATLRHGESVDGSITWDETIPETDIPTSYYHHAKPAFFGDMAWPSTGSDIDGGTNPAQIRFGDDAAVGVVTGFKRISDCNMSLMVAEKNVIATFVSNTAVPVTISLYDLRGRTVQRPVTKQTNPGANTFATSIRHLPAGLYLHAVRSDEKETVQIFKLCE